VLIPRRKIRQDRDSPHLKLESLLTEGLNVPGEYIQGFPDPDDSPNEKFLFESIPRLREDRLFRHFTNQGIDADLARNLARALSLADEDRAQEEHHLLSSLEYWANIHTHDMSGLGESSPMVYERPPYSLIDEGLYYSMDGGLNWTIGADSIGSNTRTRVAWNQSYFIVPQGQRNRYDINDDPRVNNWVTYQIKETSNNTSQVHSVYYHPHTSQLFLGQATSNSQTGRVYRGTDPSNPEAFDLVLSVGSAGYCTDIVGLPAGNQIMAVFRAFTFISDDAGDTWTQIDHPHINNHGFALDYIGGRFLLGSDKLYYYDGTSWVEASDYSARGPNTTLMMWNNGKVSLAVPGNSNGLWVSEGGLLWNPVPFFEDTARHRVRAVAWTIEDTWVARAASDGGSDYKTYVTEDENGVDNWVEANNSPGVFKWLI